MRALTAFDAHRWPPPHTHISNPDGDARTQHADWRLVQIFLIVALNVVGCITMPMFDHTQKNWPGYFAYLLVMGALVAQLPPSHLLLQWLGCAPIMM